MPPEVGTLEETAILETPVGEPEGDAERAETEELDYKALYESEKLAREKEARDARARDIQAISHRKEQEIQAQIAQNTKEILSKLNAGTLTEEQAQDAIAKGEKEIPQVVEASTAQEDTRLSMLNVQSTIKAFLLANKLGESDGAFIEIKDDRANSLNDFWEQAIRSYNEGKFQAAGAWQSAAEKEMKRLETQLTAEKTNPRRNGLGLNNRGAGGSAAGASDQTLVNRMATGEAMTPAEMARAGAAMDRGIYPKGK